jgi:hypothetical protein
MLNQEIRNSMHFGDELHSEAENLSLVVISSVYELALSC